MARSSAVRALAPLAMLAAAGCQDYNFNPVGHCLVQPGNERVTLANLSSADILFVVDDSGSMAAEQARLAANFTRFVDNLDQFNAQRAAGGQLPIDFHVAVTTTSVFWNPEFGSSFTYTCQQGVCKNSAGAPLIGENDQQVTCSREGNVLPDQANAAGVAGCGRIEHTYDFSFCSGQGSPTGVAVDGAPYPQGNFVSWQGNPRVLHFDKELYGPNAKNRQGFTRQQLIDWFVGAGIQGGNVIVGTCGSGQEQALQAAKLAVESALAGRQKDTYNLAGQAAWDPTTLTASAAADWPRKDSKLVLVFVGDEDDCSSPDDASGGVVMRADLTGSDACPRDWASDDPTKKKQFPVNDFVNYFMGLGRPVGAAFIFPAQQTSCTGTTCTPGLCCQENCPTVNACGQSSDPASPAYFCGAQASGHRLYEAANAFRGRGADVVTGSICDSDFGTLLDELADIVKPPAGLQLQTRPAEAAIALLRIADKNGQTKKTCNGPAPAGTSFDAAVASYDWWFTATGDAGGAVDASKFIYINHATGNCEADPGETYSADYIALNPPDGCAAKTDCQQALGGRAEDWGCYAPPGAPRGTCVCCEPGSTRLECQ